MAGAQGGIGHNLPRFDFFDFFDTVVNAAGMTSAEKLLQIIIARRSHAAGGGSVAPARAELARQASCSEATLKRSYRLLETFFDVNKRSGKTTEYTPRTIVTQSDVELAIKGMSPTKGAHCEPPTPTLGEPGAHSDPVHGEPGAHGARVMVSRGAPSEGHGEPPLQNVPPHPPKVNNTTLDWRERANLNVLENKLLAACNGAAANPAVAPGILLMSEPLKWLEGGCDLELDILPTVRARAHKMRPGSVKNWSYFTQAVADAKANRTAPMPSGRTPEPRSFRKKTTDEMTADEYRAHLERGGV